MAATTQANLDTFQTIVEDDSTITNAQKARVASLCYSIAVVLFGNNNTSTITATGNKSGKPDGHLG